MVWRRTYLIILFYFLIVSAKDPVFEVWHCADEILLEAVKSAATEHETTDKIAGELAVFLNNYNTTDCVRSIRLSRPSQSPEAESRN